MGVYGCIVSCRQWWWNHHRTRSKLRLGFHHVSAGPGAKHGRRVSKPDIRSISLRVDAGMVGPVKEVAQRPFTQHHTRRSLCRACWGEVSCRR